ncbi:hypothetical protein Tco_1189065 [Tanacetum coccineum]
MSTPVFVDPESSTQAGGAQSSRVPVPLPDDPCVAVRQAWVPLRGEEFVVVEPSGTRTDSSHSSASSDSTAPLSPYHPLTHVSPTPTPTRDSFHRKTVRMTMHVQPVMSPSLSTSIAEVAAMFDSTFHKRFRSPYDSSPSPTLPVQKRYRGTSELILDTDSDEDELGDKDTDEDEEDESLDADDEREGLDVEDRSLDDEDRGLDDEDRGLAAKEDQIRNMFEVGQGSGSVPKPERPERMLALRQPILTTWTDPEDGKTYTDIPTYPPLTPPVQTPPSLEWSSGSLPVSPAPSVIPSPISSPLISLTVPSPITSPAATLTATIFVDEDQFLEVRTRLELHESILHDHTHRLDAMPPTLFAEIIKDVKYEHERTAMTFGALWRPVLALEAWAGHVDTRMADLSRAGYDDHRLIHDMLVQ